MRGSVVRVGLYPAPERDAKARLFAALEDAYPVSFEGREAGDWEGLDGLLAIGPDAPPAPAGMPCLRALGEERRRDRRAALALADDPTLARSLRGAKLTDGWTGTIRGAVGDDELRDGEPDAGEARVGEHGAGDLASPRPPGRRCGWRTAAPGLP
jgi:hypothetical protein